jgi:hypothetical protein
LLEWVILKLRFVLLSNKGRKFEGCLV